MNSFYADICWAQIDRRACEISGLKSTFSSIWTLFEPPQRQPSTNEAFKKKQIFFLVFHMLSSSDPLHCKLITIWWHYDDWNLEHTQMRMWMVEWHDKALKHPGKKYAFYQSCPFFVVVFCCCSGDSFLQQTYLRAIFLPDVSCYSISDYRSSFHQLSNVKDVLNP